ncbi:MAG: signal peptidase I [Candidatus Woesearchaeota archaeon]|nr:signal peptidase I [Candidatus Woesearchaeota archaeon]
MDWQQALKKFWHFVWHEDSVASWFVSIALAFVLIKFVLYPVLGLLLGAQFPVVAVVSDSMEHPGSFDDWWQEHEDLYLRFGITKDKFLAYPMKHGFNKGDIIFLIGIKPEKVQQGHIVVYWGGKIYPIIHRVVSVDHDENGRFFQTKGDNNKGQIIEQGLDERYVPAYTSCEKGECPTVLGRAIFKVPYLGWVKILFVDLLNWIGIPAT